MAQKKGSYCSEEICGVRIKYNTPIKGQNAIHKKFAKRVLSNDYQAKYNEAVELYPQIKSKVEPEDFMDDMAKAMNAGNVKICEQIVLKSEAGECIEFSSEHSKSVVQTVRINYQYYNNVVKFFSEEKVEEYKEAYKNILVGLLTYFAYAAEDLLGEYYGKEYTDFVDSKTDSAPDAAEEN